MDIGTCQVVAHAYNCPAPLKVNNGGYSVALLVQASQAQQHNSVKHPFHNSIFHLSTSCVYFEQSPAVILKNAGAKP